LPTYYLETRKIRGNIEKLNQIARLAYFSLSICFRLMDEFVFWEDNRKVKIIHDYSRKRIKGMNVTVSHMDFFASTISLSRVADIAHKWMVERI